MKKLFLSCGTDCTSCCRYPEFLPSEISNYIDTYPLGLRVSLLPMPSGFFGYFLQRKIKKILPVVRSHFLDIRIVDAGYYSLFHGICKNYTKKKKERKDGPCKITRPVICQARPFEIHLPPRMQISVVDFANTMQICQGFGTEKTGIESIQIDSFSTTILGNRGKAYTEARKIRENYYSTYLVIAKIIENLYKDKWDTFISEIGRNIFRLLPITVLVKALYITDKIDKKTAFDYITKQKKVVENDIKEFFKEFEDKKIFKEITRPDGDKYTPDRGLYIGRMHSWIIEYARNEKALETSILTEEG